MEVFMKEYGEMIRRMAPGVHTYTDGSVLRAHWVDDAIQGQGELEKADGKITVGEWKINLQS